MSVFSRKEKEKKLTKGTKITILAAAILGLYLIICYTPLNPYILIKYPNSKYQAVFLENDQVYFGKIHKMNRKEITLREIYYLQTIAQPLQRSQSSGQDQVAEPKLTLVKLGNEIHGPEDEMVINKDYVILIENLKSEDSTVVTAINDYLEGKK